jgi:DNA-directed RNA polymerase alpha subunit
VHNEYFKLFENWAILIEQKFRDSLSINPLSIVIIPNENYIEIQKNEAEQKTHSNITIFVPEAKSDTKLTESIKNENIKIIIFLTKFYKKFLNQNEDTRNKNLKNLIEKLNKKRI